MRWFESWINLRLTLEGKSLLWNACSSLQITYLTGSLFFFFFLFNW
jgi:hypothetical protein